MDILKELKESRELNHKMAALARQKGGVTEIRRALSESARPDEDELTHRSRLLIFGYADDFMQAAEGGGVTLQLKPEEAEQVAFAVSCAYEVNRRNRTLNHEDNLLMLSKELGCYLALTMCNSMDGDLRIQKVPEQVTVGLSPYLVPDIVFQVALPGGRIVNTIEVANKVVRTIKIEDDRIGMNQWPIIRLLRDRRG